MKVCKECNVEKPLNEFPKNGVRKGKQYYKTRCMKCDYIYKRSKNYPSDTRRYRTENYNYSVYNKKYYHQATYFDRVARNVNRRACDYGVKERVSPEDLEKYLGRHDETVCYICGGKMDDIGRGFRNAQVDHVNSLKKGGTHSVNNMAWVHRYCNHLKGHLNKDEFLGFLKRVIKNMSE